MASSLAVRSVPQAIRELKRMNYQGEGWDLVRDAGRRNLKRILEQHMEATRRMYPEKLEEQGFEDHCNGYYSRHLLTSMGDIELSVPRTRTFSAVGALGAYALREDCIDRMIPTCFVFGLSTRKVGTALSFPQSLP